MQRLDFTQSCVDYASWSRISIMNPILGIISYLSIVNLTVSLTAGRISPTRLMASLSSSSQGSNPNVPLEGIKNFRDLSTAIQNSNLGIVQSPRKILRSGCPSMATEADLAYLKEFDSIALIDLRSPREWSRDKELDVGKVYDGYMNYRYSRMHKGWVKLDGSNPRFSIFSGSGLQDESERSKKKRFFVSLLNERRIARGVFMRLRKRMKVKVFLLGLLGAVSRRAQRAFRGAFFARLNDGGLSMLNEIVLDSAGPEIAAVMKVLSDDKNLPAAVFCTAGKDRTGIISCLVLSVLGASDTEILSDYCHSDSVYADLASKEAMIMALEQTDVRPEVFLRAQPQTMKDTLQYIRQKYGGINKYLDRYGFTDTYRNKLRNTLLVF